MSTKRCPGRGCLTVIPAERTMCQFCIRRWKIEAEMGTKQCLRCHRERTLDSFAANGRYRLCDECRDIYPMTKEERERSHQMSPSYEVRLRRRKYRQRQAV